MNSRVTPKDRNLIKGALRRAFARSELHKRASARFSIEHEDPKRPRVKKWAWCAKCGEVTPRWQMQLDHLNPIVPTDTKFENMSLDTLVDNLWCEENLLDLLCEMCHTLKTSLEREERKRHK